MLYETVQSWYREAEEKGLARSLSLGEARGEIKGKAERLLDLLKMKFGPLEETVRRRLFSLDNDALEACARRLFNARSPQEVFDEDALH